MPPQTAVQSPVAYRNGDARPPVHTLRTAPWIILTCAFAYALVRYIIFGGVDPAQIPVYVTNKALAAGSVIYLLMAGLETVRRRPAFSRRWGRWALHTAGLHAVISVSLLAASYYPKLFEGELLSWSGELSILAAVLTLYCFYTLGKVSEHTRRRRAAAACALVCLHLFFYGYDGWVDVAAWHGGMPPISLVGFGFGLAALVVYSLSLRAPSVGQGEGHNGIARRRA